MDTIRFSPLIIGPNFGAFKDLAKEGLIYTYSNSDELSQLLKSINTLKIDKSLLEEFIKENLWFQFGKKIYSLLY
jgi:beta-1,4-mannosyltransferase